MAYYRTRGWPDVKDVGSTRSYDLHARNGTAELIIEVKGTTSLGETVILTRNEVDLHRKHYPSNALLIVHSIELDRTGPVPLGFGGVIVERQPWSIDNADLVVIAYQYRPASGSL